MPTLKCTCGNLIDYGLIPCPEEWLLISDVEYDQFVGQIDSEKLYLSTKSLLLCPACERVWIYWGGFEHRPTEYVAAKNYDAYTSSDSRK